MQCGGRSFLFSRRDVVTGRPGDTIAADSGASASSGASRGAVLSVDAAYSLLDWETVLRVADRRLDLRSLGRPSVGVPAELRLSHNAAFLCHNGSTLIVYGGRRGHRAPYAGFSQVSEDVGIRRTTGKIVADADGARTIQWSQPTSVVLDGSTGRSACVERRGFDHCEFDGKLSAVRDPASGGVLLFARANTAAQARFVQVTRSADGVTRWAPWQLITFEGGGVAPGKHTNIYYFSVSAVRGSRRGAPERLVAVFPAVLPGSGGGIYLATSADGLAWSAPRRFLPSQALHGVRTADFPVAGVLRDPGGARGRFHLHIQHAVSFGKYLKSPSCRLAGVRDEPFLCRYELSERDLGGFGGSTSDTGQHLRLVVRRPLEVKKNFSIHPWGYYMWAHGTARRAAPPRPCSAPPRSRKPPPRRLALPLVSPRHVTAVAPSRTKRGHTRPMTDVYTHSPHPTSNSTGL